MSGEGNPGAIQDDYCSISIQLWERYYIPGNEQPIRPNYPLRGT